MGGRHSAAVAQMIPAVGIVSIPFDFFRWDPNVRSVFSALCVDVAIDVLDFGWIAVRIVAIAGVGMIGHMPCRIEVFVQRLILRWMVSCSVILLILGLDWHRQSAAKTDSQEQFA
jgi:hypothetical protein